MTTWAVDLADVGAIYPFQGTEFIMFLAGLAFWIWWHWAQIRNEKTEIRHELDSDARGDATRKAIERY
jgi:hypothetical protein